MSRIATTRRATIGRNKNASGFTLIELMIVIVIILILVSVAIPMYQESIKHAREAVLKQDLFNLRQAIQAYTEDKLRAPQSLDDLVSAGYFREIPTDPITKEKDWQVDQEDTLLSVDQTQPGITDVHSAAGGSGSDGTPYSQW
jgi:general secretion pathway protein G